MYTIYKFKPLTNQIITENFLDAAADTHKTNKSFKLRQYRCAYSAFTCSEYDYSFLQLYYLNFNVTIATATQRIVRIQKRTAILLS